MKIPEQQSQQAAKITNVNRVNRVGGNFDLNMAYGANGATNGPDKATLSGFAQDVQRVTELVKQLPDIRDDKVNAIRTKIKDDTYGVPVPDIVESLFRLSNEEHGG